MAVAERPQHLEALEKANAVRFARADLKKELRTLTYSEGLERIAALLLDPPSELATMNVERLVLVVPGFGRKRSNRALAKAGISPFRSVEALTLRQAAALAECLRMEAAR